MRVFIKFLVRGLIFITPIGVTILLIVSAAGWITEKIEKTNLHGVALFLLLVGAIGFLALIGWLGSSFVLRPFTLLLESVIKRIPIVNFVYSSLKDVVGALMGDKKKFDKPVIVRVYGDGLWKPGFLTQEDLTELGKPGMVAVYLPHSYAIAGNVFFVDKKDVTEVDIHSSEWMKLIVSGGVAWNPEEEQKEKPAQEGSAST